MDGRAVGGKVGAVPEHIFPPQTPHQKDTYLQPIRPCRATVTLEARLSLGRRDKEALLGRGPRMLLLPPLFEAGPPVPDL